MIPRWAVVAPPPNRKTTIAKGSKIHTNKKATLQLAKELNERNIDVTFLPEKLFEKKDLNSRKYLNKLRGFL